MKNLKIGTRLEVSQDNQMYIATIKAKFEDYFLVIDRRRNARFVFEGDYKVA